MGERRTIGILEAQWRVLSFRFTADDLDCLDGRHLVYGLLVTWAVGIGRYWDHPDPYLLQSFGLGSLPILLALALFLWAVLLPLRPANWSLVNLLTFLSLTALPALLYAVPVERFVSLSTASRLNVAFLATVAAWRVALLARYLARRTDLSHGLLVLALGLPLALVVAVLTMLNLEQAVFSVMAGLRDDEGTAADGAYHALFILSTFAVLASPLLLIAYGFAVVRRRRGD